MVLPDQKSVEPVTIVNFKVAETKELNWILKTMIIDQNIYSAQLQQVHIYFRAETKEQVHIYFTQTTGSEYLVNNHS